MAFNDSISFIFVRDYYQSLAGDGWVRFKDEVDVAGLKSVING